MLQLLEEVLPHVADKFSAFLVLFVEALDLGADLLHNLFFDQLAGAVLRGGQAGLKGEDMLQHRGGNCGHLRRDGLTYPIQKDLEFFRELERVLARMKYICCLLQL
jgi:hypothetical protein